MADLVALHEREGRLPSTKSTSSRERALAMWLLCRRKTLTPARSPPSIAKASKLPLAGSNEGAKPRTTPNGKLDYAIS
jgi:hypothetical protein